MTSIISWPGFGKGVGPQLILQTFVAAILLCFLSTRPAADLADKLQDMEGWTIIAVTQVDGDFEGCDFDQKISFLNGMILTCFGFGYSYSFMPSAIIFAKTIVYQNSEFYQIKVLIDDEIYDMNPIALK